MIQHKRAVKFDFHTALDGLAVVDPLDEVLQRRPEVLHEFPCVVPSQAQVTRASIAQKRRGFRRPAAPADWLHGTLRLELNPSEQLPARRRGAVVASPRLRQRLDPLIFLAYFLDGRPQALVHPDLRRVGRVGPARAARHDFRDVVPDFDLCGNQPVLRVHPTTLH